VVVITALLALAAASAEAAAAQVRSGEPPVRHTMVSDEHPLTVWEKRPREVRGVLLLLHGRTWSTLPNFDLHVAGEELSLMDGLTERGFATYGLDQRGYGATPRDETGWLTPDRAVADLAAVLRWIRAREPGGPVHLFGWSQGSMVSQLLAQRHPDLIDGLVLFGYPWRPGREVPEERSGGEPPREPTTAEAAASDFITPGSITRRAVDAYVAAALAADPVRADWTAGHQWNALDAARVTVPTLVLHGEFDPLAPPEAQRALFEGLGTTDKAWVVVPGGDHAAFLETPRPYFIAMLEAFLLRGG
jgi:pimeloyl-ACP methyl ester carboxylesterase